MNKKNKDNFIIYVALLTIIILAFTLFSGCILPDNDERETKVLVYNNHKNKLYLDCIYYYDIGEDELRWEPRPYGEIESNSTNVLSHSIKDMKKKMDKEVENIELVKIDLGIYTEFNSLIESRTAFQKYEYPYGESYDLLAIINQDGDDITFVKLPEELKD